MHQKYIPQNRNPQKTLQADTTREPLPYLVVDRFNIALFSALEQSHCALVVCDSKQVTVAFYSVY